MLFKKGDEIHAASGYCDDPRNTDNAWLESKVVHFHCTPELGDMFPLNLKKRGGKDKGGQVRWLDADRELEPRYADMARRPHNAPSPPHTPPPRNARCRPASPRPAVAARAAHAENPAPAPRRH